MNRVIIDRASSIEIKSTVLVIDNEMKLPLKAIDYLILSHRTDISLKDIATIAKNDTAILIVTTNPKEFIHIQKKYNKNAHLKEAQYHALVKRVEIAKFILEAKIHKSYETLKHFNLNFEKGKILKELQKAKDLQTLLGIEGSLAKEYFKHYFTLFPKILAKGQRSKNPPLDPVNALLSYVYTIFYFEISTWLHFYGFEPLIGYLHTSFRDHLALSSDILEFFRAEIDKFVAYQFLDKHLTIQDFSKNKKSVLLTHNGRKKLWTNLKIFIEGQESAIKQTLATMRDIIEKNSSLNQMPK
ncbi:CRISPR-associated endonuclease Cas1 [Nitratiruptor tergarcus]|uniref:CRISPR-associated endonuclease Cas1 n=1 Tax=Nitratiruptor tergarcus DSM 16512 TaxID=1069081 RepID=A0A1W1WSD4_9BACT|nr:CRISPR-associated endonuclease Cas1 [Nitratiruptor tergarcus]SMC09207.1 CRISP-associated protein Cas1 [Nitratiruptor tergarcus DSM 16512]